MSDGCELHRTWFPIGGACWMCEAERHGWKPPRERVLLVTACGCTREIEVERKDLHCIEVTIPVPSANTLLWKDEPALPEHKFKIRIFRYRGQRTPDNRGLRVFQEAVQ